MQIPENMKEKKKQITQTFKRAVELEMFTMIYHCLYSTVGKRPFVFCIQLMTPSVFLYQFYVYRII